MSNIQKVQLMILLIAVSMAACQKEGIGPAPQNNGRLILPGTPYDYTTLILPAHLTNSVLQGQNAAMDNDNTSASNPTTDHGATLGRVLFYDRRLSANGRVSCASCHKQELGFSDNAVLSAGFSGQLTRRHSMSLVNARWYGRGRFFWDERAATLEEQVLMPFQDPVEMGLTLQGLVTGVQARDFYPPLFQNAFGTAEITSERIAMALAQYVRSIVSVQSQYDIGRQQVAHPTEDFPNLTASENNGKRLFFQPVPLGGGGCIGCHSTEAFIDPDNGPTNNGLDPVSTEDLGVYEAIPNQAFIGTFKVPSLKSIELTAPYMHDGRFASLEAVVEHYNSGIQPHPNLGDALLDNDGLPVRLNFTSQQKADLVAFLKTLTDDALTNDVRFSNPFN